MKVLIQQRAEIAIRSLENSDRRRVLKAIADLESQAQAQHRGEKWHRLSRTVNGKTLFSYRIGLKYRLVISIDGDTCTVEDVVSHDRWARRGSEWTQE